MISAVNELVATGQADSWSIDIRLELSQSRQEFLMHVVVVEKRPSWAPIFAF